MSDNTSIGNYTIVGELARGSFSRVYIAQHVVLSNRMVAIKLMLSAPLDSSGKREEFLQEARFLEMLKHPHILPVVDVGIHEGIPYLVTEYAPYGSLRSRLSQHSPHLLPIEESLTILYQIGLALEYAHQQQIIHRDLKPENILFNTRGDALLMDFGIATTLATASIKIVDNSGTPTYMAPEQFRGKISKESDQYALGCIAYELFTGQTPFIALDFFSLGFKHLTEPPLAPSKLNSQVPGHVEQAILKALSKERTDRYSDIPAFISALFQAPSPSQDSFFTEPETDMPAPTWAPQAQVSHSDLFPKAYTEQVQLPASFPEGTLPSISWQVMNEQNTPIPNFPKQAFGTVETPLPPVSPEFQAGIPAYGPSGGYADTPVWGHHATPPAARQGWREREGFKRSMLGVASLVMLLCLMSVLIFRAFASSSNQTINNNPTATASLLMPSPVITPTTLLQPTPTPYPQVTATANATPGVYFQPTQGPTPRPTARPTQAPTSTPSPTPTPTPTPTDTPTPTPTDTPTPTPTDTVTPTPTDTPTPMPTDTPTPTPTP